MFKSILDYIINIKLTSLLAYSMSFVCSCSEGITPVHIAAMQGRCENLHLLLLHGGDPYLLDPVIVIKVLAILFDFRHF